jgi:hypothetical protein
MGGVLICLFGVSLPLAIGSAWRPPKTPGSLHVIASWAKSELHPLFVHLAKVGDELLSPLRSVIRNSPQDVGDRLFWYRDVELPLLHHLLRHFYFPARIWRQNGGFEARKVFNDLNLLSVFGWDRLGSRFRNDTIVVRNWLTFCTHNTKERREIHIDSWSSPKVFEEDRHVADEKVFYGYGSPSIVRISFFWCSGALAAFKIPCSHPRPPILLGQLPSNGRLFLDSCNAVLGSLRLLLSDGDLLPSVHLVHESTSGSGLILAGENLGLLGHLVELDVKQRGADGGERYTNDGDFAFKAGHSSFAFLQGILLLACGCCSVWVASRLLSGNRYGDNLSELIVISMGRDR